MPTLETARLLLRPWRDADRGPLVAILTDPQVNRHLFGTDPEAAKHAAAGAYERRVETWEREGLGFWALEDKATGELVGWSGLQRIDFEEGVVGEVEVGWTLGHAWWGRGFAPEAGAAALEWGFGTASLERVYAFCHPENARSERVMRKLGMCSSGTTRDLRDGAVSRLYVITAEEWRARRDQAFG